MEQEKNEEVEVIPTEPTEPMEPTEPTEGETETENASFTTLYQKVARRCYVTSEDPLIVERLTSIIKNAVYSVKRLLGIFDENFDFSLPSMEQELFLNYCFYRWNNRSQKEFENNYIGDIIGIRTNNEIAYKKSLEKPNEKESDEGTL